MANSTEVKRDKPEVKLVSFQVVSHVAVDANLKDLQHRTHETAKFCRISSSRHRGF